MIRSTSPCWKPKFLELLLPPPDKNQRLGKFGMRCALFLELGHLGFGFHVFFGKILGFAKMFWQTSPFPVVFLAILPNYSIVLFNFFPDCRFQTFNKNTVTVPSDQHLGATWFSNPPKTKIWFATSWLDLFWHHNRFVPSIVFFPRSPCAGFDILAAPTPIAWPWCCSVSLFFPFISTVAQ